MTNLELEQEEKFLYYIIENLVNNKEDIKIERTIDELGILLTIKVNPADMGLIIWKKWNTVNSLRSLLKILWLKLNKKINLKIVE